MNPSELAWLLSCADQLRPTSMVPVDVATVARELGLRVRKLHSPHISKAAELRRSPAGKYEVVLYRCGSISNLSRAERFTLAHEIGHVLIDARLRWEPANPREYFVRERWCHQFASHLLIPSELATLDEVPTAKVALRRLLTVSDQCDVTKTVAAWRLAQATEGVGFAEFEFTTDAKQRRVLRTMWSAPEIPSTGLTRRKMFRTPDLFFTVALEASGPNRLAEVRVNDDVTITFCRSVRNPAMYLSHFVYNRDVYPQTSTARFADLNEAKDGSSSAIEALSRL